MTTPFDNILEATKKHWIQLHPDRVNRRVAGFIVGKDGSALRAELTYCQNSEEICLQAVFADQVECRTAQALTLLLLANSQFNHAQAVPDRETRTLRVQAARSGFPINQYPLSITVRHLFQDFRRLINSELLHTAVQISNGRFRGKDFPDLSAA